MVQIAASTRRRHSPVLSTDVRTVAAILRRGGAGGLGRRYQGAVVTTGSMNAHYQSLLSLPRPRNLTTMRPGSKRKTFKIISFTTARRGVAAAERQGFYGYVKALEKTRSVCPPL